MAKHQQALRGAGRFVGDIIRDQHPVINHLSADDIAEGLTIVIAEALQSWLDAGSERENTMEELFEPIRDHVAGWAEEGA